jgi:hypothetical protein
MAIFELIQREINLNLLNNRPAADIIDGDGDIDMMDVDDSWHDDEPLFSLRCIATVLLLLVSLSLHNKLLTFPSLLLVSS